MMNDPFEWIDPEVGRQIVIQPEQEDAEAARCIAVQRGWSRLRERAVELLITRRRQVGSQPLHDIMNSVSGVKRLVGVPEEHLPALVYELERMVA